MFELPNGAMLSPASRSSLIELFASAGECEMTPGEEPLVCSCGNHTATYVPPKKKQPGRWMVLAVKVAGHKPRTVTTVMDKAKALERVRALCADVAAPSCISESSAVEATPSTPPDLRERIVATNYDDAVRRE